MRAYIYYYMQLVYCRMQLYCTYVERVGLPGVMWGCWESIMASVPICGHYLLLVEQWYSAFPSSWTKDWCESVKTNTVTDDGEVVCFHARLGRRWWASPISVSLVFRRQRTSLLTSLFFSWWGLLQRRVREVCTGLMGGAQNFGYVSLHLFFNMFKRHTLAGMSGRCPSGPRPLCFSSCFLSFWSSSASSLPASSGKSTTTSIKTWNRTV